MKLLLLTLPWTIAGVAKSVLGYSGHYGECYGYVDATKYGDGYPPLDVSDECCAGQAVLYGYDGSPTALRRERDRCDDIIAEEFPMWENCNIQGKEAECTVDYHGITCDDELMQLCREEGGQVVEGDYELICKTGGVKMSLKLLNKLYCVAKTCEPDYLIKVKETQMSDCEMVRLGDSILVNGERVQLPGKDMDSKTNDSIFLFSR